MEFSFLMFHMIIIQPKLACVSAALIYVGSAASIPSSIVVPFRSILDKGAQDKRMLVF